MDHEGVCRQRGQAGLHAAGLGGARHLECTPEAPRPCPTPPPQERSQRVSRIPFLSVSNTNGKCGRSVRRCERCTGLNPPHARFMGRTGRVALRGCLCAAPERGPLLRAPASVSSSVKPRCKVPGCYGCRGLSPHAWCIRHTQGGSAVVLLLINKPQLVIMAGF